MYKALDPNCDISEFPTWSRCCWVVGACFSSLCSSLSPCVCLAVVPMIPSPYAHPALSQVLLTRHPCVSVSEMHPPNSQHWEAWRPICLPWASHIFFMMHYLYQFLICSYLSVCVSLMFHLGGADEPGIILSFVSKYDVLASVWLRLQSVKWSWGLQWAYHRFLLAGLHCCKPSSKTVNKDGRCVSTSSHCK